MEGASRVLLRLLAKRFPDATDRLLPMIQDLTPELQDELSEKILDALSQIARIITWIRERQSVRLLRYS